MPTFIPIRYSCRILAVHDGDTITISFDMECNFQTRVTLTGPCRLFGLNCPELKTPTGLLAKAFTEKWVQEHLGPYQFEQTTVSGREKYGRFLGRILAANGACLNDDLLAAGQAVKMFGDAER